MSYQKRTLEAASRITVGELRDALAIFADGDEVTFGAADCGRNPLLFYRVKNRGPIAGPALVHVELHELTDGAMEDESR